MILKRIARTKFAYTPLLMICFRVSLIIFFALVASFCLPGVVIAGDGSAAQIAGISTHQILPSETDSRINTFSGQGFAHWSWFYPSVRDTGQLVVFLPGTGGKGNGSAPFNLTAASLGFHVLCLAYPDEISMSTFNNSDDQGAFAKARTNVITVPIYQAMRLMPQYSVVDADQVPYPYKHSRLLTGSFPQTNAHGAPIHDQRYVNAWKYLLTELVQ